MKITICTTTKTVTVQSASIKDLSQIKKMIEVIGENPNDYSIASDVQYYNNPVWPIQPFYESPKWIVDPNFSPKWDITCSATD